MKVIPVTDFRSTARQVLEWVKQAPVILTQRSRPAAVVMDYEVYRAREERLEQLELALDNLTLAQARASAEDFISLDELVTDYEEANETTLEA